MTDPDPYDPGVAVRAARYEAFLAAGGGPVAAPVDAAIVFICDHLREYLSAAKNCAPQNDLDRGHDEALDWVCSELDLLKEATR